MGWGTLFRAQLWTTSESRAQQYTIGKALTSAFQRYTARLSTLRWSQLMPQTVWFGCVSCDTTYYRPPVLPPPPTPTQLEPYPHPPLHLFPSPLRAPPSPLHSTSIIATLITYLVLGVQVRTSLDQHLEATHVALPCCEHQCSVSILKHGRHGSW